MPRLIYSANYLIEANKTNIVPQVVGMVEISSGGFAPGTITAHATFPLPSPYNYDGRLRDVSSIDCSLNGAYGRVSFAITNADLGEVSNVAADKYVGWECKVHKIIILEDGTLLGILLLHGVITSYTMTDRVVDMDVVTRINVGNTITPRRVNVKCPWVFKGTECGYSGVLTTCNKLYNDADGCSGRSNQHRFGGFPLRLPEASIGAVSGQGGAPTYQLIRDDSAFQLQRAILEFDNTFSVTDDPTNNKTVISVTTIANDAVTTAKILDGAVTPAKLSSVAQVLNFKNLLINGAMQVSQRSTSETGRTVSGYYTADRWHMLVANTAGTWTQSIENDAPSGSEFRRSLKMTCTTANSTLDAGDQLVIQQRLEGQNLQAIRKGTSNANQLTLSFWVKAGTTGTYIAELQDNDNTRFVSASYSVSATNTWEKKTITFPADTSGVLDNDNAFSLAVNFWLAAGSNFTGGTPLQTTWGTATNTRATGQVNLSAGNVGGTNYWQVTGVQLERGSTATEFEYVPFDMQFLRCYRYLPSVNYYVADFLGADYYFGVQAGVGNYYMWINFLVPARTHPVSISISAAADFKIFSSYNSINYTPTTLVCITSSNKTALIDAAAGGVAAAIGSVAYMRFESPTSGNPRILFNGCEL